MIIEKQCSHCKEIRPIKEFGIYNKTKMQHKPYCQACEPLVSRRNTSKEAKYGEKTAAIKEILRQREIVLEERLKYANPLSQEFFDIYTELNQIRVKL